MYIQVNSTAVWFLNTCFIDLHAHVIYSTITSTTLNNVLVNDNVCYVTAIQLRMRLGSMADETRIRRSSPAGLLKCLFLSAAAAVAAVAAAAAATARPWA